MNLLTLLVKELKEWPEGVDALSQSFIDSEIYNADGLVSLNPRQWLSVRSADRSIGLSGVYPTVTKGQWMKAKQQTRKSAYDIRDAIIELEAYEEHFRILREELAIELLAEGFVLVKAINTTLDKIDSSLEASDPRGWVVGDTLKCLVSASSDCYTVGAVYKVIKGAGHYDLHITDNYGKDSCGGFDYPEFTDDKYYMFTKVEASHVDRN